MTLIKSLFECFMRRLRKTLARILPGRLRARAIYFTPEIVAGLAISFPFVKVYNGGILGQATFSHMGWKMYTSFWMRTGSPDLYTPAGMASTPCSFPLDS